MPHEVKMPQLGMTQDSGVIVSWLKAEGDAVSIGDPLIEVETDKATVEVEAQAGGFIAGLRAAEGDDVPVGNVIAVIVENESEVPDHAASTKLVDSKEQKSKPEPEAKAETPTAFTDASAVVPEPSPVLPSLSIEPATERVLASPKAKRLALEQGIDLSALRAQGISEPIHASDLAKATVGGQSVLMADIGGDAVNALLDASQETKSSTLFAAFAAGAWRDLFNTDEASIALRELDGTVTNIGRAEEAVVLNLVDLSKTRLTAYAPANGTTLTVAESSGRFLLTLAFTDSSLPLPHAAALLDDIAARVENPIRQLL